jgi:uncharacterized RDD family membrane protein YckC
MINDSVREELETKIVTAPSMKQETPLYSPSFKADPLPVEPAPKVSDTIANVPSLTVPKKEIPRPTPPLRRETNPLNVPKTSPTLVGFQTKNATLPDWRLQLQNSVRQRKGGSVQRTDVIADGSQTKLVTQGANALKAEVIEVTDPEAQKLPANPTVANALRRIDESRKTFLPEKPKRPSVKNTAAAKSYPFNVVSRTVPKPVRTPDGRPVISESPKPTLVPTFKIEKKKFDTNKLPPLPEDDKIADAATPRMDQPEGPKVRMVMSKPEISIHASQPSADATLGDVDEIDDLPPVSLRFNAALFDLIIGAFASFALLSPLVLLGGDWFSLSGLAAFCGAWATTMFIYMTLAIGMYGKTLGMRMFGLELIDAEENDYPTFHQAAVHSAVFIISLPLLGAGFIPMIFNEEQRAAHDLAAGTIIVTEF